MVKITDDQLAKIHDQALKGMRFGSQMVVDLCEEVRDARLTTSQLAQTMPCVDMAAGKDEHVCILVCPKCITKLESCECKDTGTEYFCPRCHWTSLDS